MKCNKCGQDNSAGSRFCSGCGNKLEKLCPACQQPVAETARFCPQCGQSLTDQPTTVTEMKDNVIAGDVNQTVQTYSNHVDQSVHHSVVNIYQAAPVAQVPVAQAPVAQAPAQAAPKEAPTEQAAQAEQARLSIENRILLQSAKYRFEVIKADGKLVSVLHRHPFTKYNQNIALPSYDDMGYPIVEIGSRAFSYCTTLRSITFPEGIRAIGAEAFFNCASLTSLELPSGVISIGKLAFSSCVQLTELNIPDSVTDIGEGAFQQCTNVKSIHVGNGVTQLSRSAFSLNLAKSVSLPEGLRAIHPYVFYNCTNLTDIQIPAGVTEIGQSAFWNCKALQRIILPANLKSIGPGAFEGCSSLRLIRYAGTVAQWKALVKNTRKAIGSVPAVKIVCTDGAVPIKTGLF